MNDDTVMCAVYKNPRKEGMYIYVSKDKGLEPVPEVLLASMGQPEHVMDLLLTPQRTLARVDVNEVMAALDAQGFFLQMPPGNEALAEG